jgi:hypothetical protein
MNIKQYVDKKIKDIKQQRAIEAKWTLEVLKFHKTLLEKFNKIFDDKFMSNLDKLVKVLEEGKEFDDLIRINRMPEQSKLLVYNNFTEVSIVLNYETKNLEIKKISTPGVAVYDLTKNGINNAKVDFIDAITNEFQYSTNPKEKEFYKIQKFKQKFGKKIPQKSSFDEDDPF